MRLRHRYAACIEIGLLDEAAALRAALNLSDAEVAAHAAGAQDWDDKTPPGDFDNFAVVGPGRFDPRVLQQSTWWVDVLRRPHRSVVDPVDFTDVHLVAVIGMIRANAWRWADLPEVCPSDMVDPESFLAEARRCIEQTPLMVALTEEADRRGLVDES